MELDTALTVILLIAGVLGIIALLLYIIGHR